MILPINRLTAAFAAAIWLMISSAVGVAGTPSDVLDNDQGHVYRGDDLPLAAVYLSIKEPGRSYVLGPQRAQGNARRAIVQRLANRFGVEPVLPILTDVLQEAMTAVRIAVHDGRSLSDIADMHGARVILAGRLQYVRLEEWQVSWSISTVIGMLRWKKFYKNYEDALSDGLEKVSRVLAGELAVDPYPLPKLLPMISSDRELEELEKISRQKETGGDVKGK